MLLCLSLLLDFVSVLACEKSSCWSRLCVVRATYNSNSLALPVAYYVYLLECTAPPHFWWRCGAQFSKPWPSFRPKCVIFWYLYQTWSLEFIPASVNPYPFSNFQNKMVKFYSLYQTKIAKKKPIPFGATHTYVAYTGECTRPQFRGFLFPCESHLLHLHVLLSLLSLRNRSPALNSIEFHL